MAQDAGVKVESIESLTKEANLLKIKLEDERQKLNDVTSKYLVGVYNDYFCTVLQFKRFHCVNISSCCVKIPKLG